MDGNFKVRCVDSTINGCFYTTGKVYEFRDGHMMTDSGIMIPTEPGHIDSFEQWARYSSAKWEPVDESDNKKIGGFIHCKICKRRFGLKSENRYTAVKVETIFPLRTTLYDAFNCTYCGCQNIVGIRESEVKSNE